MSVRNAAIVAVNRLDSLGSREVQAACVLFDLGGGIGFTGSTDTVTIGGPGGWAFGLPTSATLAETIQSALGILTTLTVTLYDEMRGPPGQQFIATNGPAIYAVSPTVSADNIVGVQLYSALSGGVPLITVAAPWDRPAGIYVNFTAQ
jgi:hypothetical protein